MAMHKTKAAAGSQSSLQSMLPRSGSHCYTRGRPAWELAAALPEAAFMPCCPSCYVNTRVDHAALWPMQVEELYSLDRESLDALK